MDAAPIIDSNRHEQLMSRIARKISTEQEMIFPFVDFTNFLTDLLLGVEAGHSRLISSGLASPEAAMAAERAGFRLDEVVGSSPFASDPRRLVDQLTTGAEIVYLANPNRITGANNGLADLETVAEALPDGLLIIDEHYHDFYGITGLQLCQNYSNVLILRSLTGAYGIGSDQSGFVVGSPDRIDQLRQIHDSNQISFTLYKILSTSLSSGEVLSNRLEMIHDESLRIAQALGRLKIQARLSATDFLLLRVASPKQVAKFLASYKVELSNLDQFDGLGNYLRYRIQSPMSNDILLQACERMPQAYYQMKSIERQPLQLRREGEETASDLSEVSLPRKQNVNIPETTLK